jgi:hypothetical protein
LANCGCYPLSRYRSTKQLSSAHAYANESLTLDTFELLDLWYSMILDTVVRRTMLMYPKNSWEQNNMTRR